MNNWSERTAPEQLPGAPEGWRVCVVTWQEETMPRPWKAWNLLDPSGHLRAPYRLPRLVQDAWSAWARSCCVWTYRGAIELAMLEIEGVRS